MAPSPGWNDPSPQTVQRLLRFAAANDPGAHGDASVAPSWHALPASQSVQSSGLPMSILLPCVPSGHGRGADEPRRQKDPGEQAKHAVAPGSGCRFPASHASHSSLRLRLAKVPGLHRAGGLPPPAHEWPASHSKQSGSPSASVALANVPGAHVGASLSDAPSGQKSPASQRRHAVALYASW